MEYWISFLEGILACLTPMLIIPFSFWMLGGGIRNNKASLRTSFGCALGFGTAFLAVGAGLTVPAPTAGAVILLLGLLLLCHWEERLVPMLRNALFGAALASYWTAARGFFPEKLTVQGLGLLTCFALGMAVPFLLLGAFADRLKDLFPKGETAFHALSGIGLLAAGILMILMR